MQQLPIQLARRGMAVARTAKNRDPCRGGVPFAHGCSMRSGATYSDDLSLNTGNPSRKATREYSSRKSRKPLALVDGSEGSKGWPRRAAGIHASQDRRPSRIRWAADGGDPDACRPTIAGTAQVTPSTALPLQGSPPGAKTVCHDWHRGRRQSLAPRPRERPIASLGAPHRLLARTATRHTTGQTKSGSLRPCAGGADRQLMIAPGSLRRRDDPSQPLSTRARILTCQKNSASAGSAQPLFSIGSIGSPSKGSSLGAWRVSAELFPKDDPTLREIVRRHFNVNAVAHDRSNAKAAHLAGRVSDDPILIVEQDREPAVRQYLFDNPLNGEQFFFCHADPSLFAERPMSGRLVASWR